ncbi:MAG: 3'-5' exonuclease [Bacteroidota bacterium]
MALDFSKIIIIDLEATCWQKKKPKGVHHDVIEFGVAVLEVATGDILANEGLLVQPTSSEVSPFCTELTTITAEMVADAPDFKTACQQLGEQFNTKRHPWASFGAYDYNQLQRQCSREQVAFPLSAQHLNVKALFALKHGLQQPLGMAGVLQRLNLPLEGTHHRGIDDARNIAHILYRLLN